MYYRAAKAAALDSDHRVAIAALLIRKGSLVKIGVASSRTDPSFTRYFSKSTRDGRSWESCKVSQCAHAELDALTQAQPGDKLIVLRWRRSDEGLDNAKPCHHCMKRIKHRRLTSVYYSNNQGEIERLPL